MNHPFGAHAHAEGTPFANFVPIDGALFSQNCLENNFQTSSLSNLCGPCGALQTLNCMKNTQERAGETYGKDLTLCEANNKYLSFKQMTEKINHQKNIINFVFQI